MIGKKLLHYEIEEKLGAGGMGEVYRARDTKLGRDVAIKLLPEDMYRDPERRRRFEKEARVIAALNHPNIVTVYSVEEVDGRPFLTMELVQGRTLREMIPAEGVSLAKFFSVAVPLVDAMCSAHARGITHRDLKPANVMISDEGRLKVLDFGLAKLIQDTQSVEHDETVGMSDTQEGHILGTVSYMSPEQVEGKVLDGRSDIFSLGIVFYEMLTGARPFTGDSNASTISSILRDTPTPVTEIRETLPHHLGRIIRRCLAKDPGRRYQSPVDLRNDLQELAEEVDSGDLVVDSVGSTASDATAAASEDPVRSVPSDSLVLPGTRRTYGRILGVVGILVVAAIIFVVARNRTPAPPDTPSTAMSALQGATLGVIGFENLSDPEDSENLGRVLMGLVTTGLAESGGLKVSSTAKVLAARRESGADARGFDASLAPEVARRAGADVMLVGQVVHNGEEMILTAELVDVASGNALGSVKKEAASSAQLFDLAGAIAVDVRNLMGVPAAAAASGDIDLAESLTDSPEAYRRFAAGEVAVHQRQYDQAVEQYQQAIRIDSTFALAYLRLLLAHTWNGETDRGLAAAKRGWPHATRLPERWRVVYQANIDYYEGRPDAAYDRMTRLVETDDDIPDAYNLLGEIRSHYSKYQSARHARDYFERALEIDPTFEVVLFHLVEDYIVLNDVESLEALIEKYRNRNPSDPWVREAELSLLQAQQRHEEVIRRIEDRLREGDLTRWTMLTLSLEPEGRWQRAFELSQAAIERGEKGYNHAFALRHRGTAQVGLGNVAAGIQDFDAAVAAFEAMGVSGRWADSIESAYRWIQVYFLIETGSPEPAVARARLGVEEDVWSTQARHALVRAQITSGDIAGAEATLRELVEVKQRNRNPGDAFYALISEAELEVARGNMEAAVGTLHRIDALPIETRDPVVQWIIAGDVKAAAGDVDGAIDAYRASLYSTRYLIQRDAAIGTLRIPVNYKLARLEEASGERSRAIEHYRAYLACWGSSDMPIPAVSDARSRLEALEKM